MLRLNIRNLTCQRGDRVLVSDLNFQLAAGHWLHIQGRNGCGKSTLLRTIAGISAASEGEIRWDGMNEDAPPALLLGHQPALKREFTAAENLHWGVPGDTKQMNESAAELALHQVGLGKHCHLPVRFFSEGQKRRLLLARLLVQPAVLWLLDEPLNGLDSDGVNMLSGLIQQHLAAGGMAIVTSHLPLPLHHGETLCLS